MQHTTDEKLMSRDRWFDWAAQTLSQIVSDTEKGDAGSRIHHVQGFMNDLGYRLEAERRDERQELRKLFNGLRMQFGASAGSATGVIVRNDFGEEFVFQLDRDALNNLLGRFNSHKLGTDSHPVTEPEETA